MPFTKGSSGNPSGKPKGTPNKHTRQLRELITRFLSKHVREIETDWKYYNRKDQVKLLCALLPYVVPKVQEASTVHQDGHIEEHSA